MLPSEWDFESKVEEDKDDVARPKSPDERVDQFGIRTALFVLCVAFFIAAMWLVSRPSFDNWKTSQSAMRALTRRETSF
jgi:hypothetical protein